MRKGDGISNSRSALHSSKTNRNGQTVCITLIKEEVKMTKEEIPKI